MTPVASTVKTQKSFSLNGGRDRTRTCDLLRVKHYLLSLFIDCTATYKPVIDVIIV
jgi:hypothetical protein